MGTTIPSFDEWVAYCFEHGYADFRGYSEATGESMAAIEAREERFAEIPSGTLTEYATKLFSNPSFLADRYTDQQIADATWFLFGIGSGYFHEFRDKAVPIDAQVTLMRSVAAMYTDLFDQLCNHHATQPDGLFTNAMPIDMAVDMIWDMDCIELPLHFPRKHKHLVDPSFEVLDAALFNCRTASCKGSALHGLGHVHHAHKKRVEAIIDRFLELPDQPDHLREYAADARRGNIL